MSTFVEQFESSACNTPGSSYKAEFTKQSTSIRRGISIDVSDHSVDGVGIKNSLNRDTCAVLLSHSDGDNFEADVASALTEIRRYEKESKRPIFVILSIVHVVTKEAFLKVCKFVYSSGFDGILIEAPDVDAEASIAFIRSEALGMRGRRVKIIVESFSASRLASLVSEVDGVVLGNDFGLETVDRFLAQQKMLYTFETSLADTHKVDVLLTPAVGSSTPSTIPSSPILSSRDGGAVVGRSFLLNQVEKFITVNTRLILALSDDSCSVMELSCQGRLCGKSLPPILGLSAAESVCRFMGCLFGVIALQTPSFISVSSVVTNALAWAKSTGLVQVGDHVLVVLQPPPVTASTNIACYEEIVQSKYVE